MSNKPTGYIDPQGLDGWGDFGSLGSSGGADYGSAAESAGANLPADQASTVLNTLPGPHYDPLTGSAAVDLGYSVDAYTGASDAFGFGITTSEKSPLHMDVCAYRSLCEREGIGMAAGYGVTGTISEGEMSSSSSTSTGYTGTGGWLAEFTLTWMKDTSGNRAGSIGYGRGEGAFVGKITCNPITVCLFN